MVIVCGIDESGRGPVLGPLVIAGINSDEACNSKLKKLGVKDSKLLTLGKREELFGQITKLVNSFATIKILPAEIDHAVNSDELNLNWLEAQKSAEIINQLQPNKVIVDTPSPNTTAYKRYLAALIGDIELVAEHKADVNHVECAAASIIAKVTRDSEIKILKEKIGINFGSGYLTDQVTRKFLEECFETHHFIFRKSWMPYRAIVMKKNQLTLDKF